MCDMTNSYPPACKGMHTNKYGGLTSDNPRIPSRGAGIGDDEDDPIVQHDCGSTTADCHQTKGHELYMQHMNRISIMRSLVGSSASPDFYFRDESIWSARISTNVNAYLRIFGVRLVFSFPRNTLLDVTDIKSILLIGRTTLCSYVNVQYRNDMEFGSLRHSSRQVGE